MPHRTQPRALLLGFASKSTLAERVLFGFAFGKMSLPTEAFIHCVIKQRCGPATFTAPPCVIKTGTKTICMSSPRGRENLWTAVPPGVAGSWGSGSLWPPSPLFPSLPFIPEQSSGRLLSASPHSLPQTKPFLTLDERPADILSGVWRPPGAGPRIQFVFLARQLRGGDVASRSGEPGTPQFQVRKGESRLMDRFGDRPTLSLPLRTGPHPPLLFASVERHPLLLLPPVL